MAKILGTDKIKKRQSIAHNTDDGIVIATEQDITEIIEQNKREYNASSTTWGDGDVFSNKIASIPFTVIDELNKQKIMRGFHVVDSKRFKAWLNNPDNRFFRTKQGTV
tara:strand:- start:1500 stop:1823 length:324 start_codon:yes stop_codon:yes gene_type:complete